MCPCYSTSEHALTHIGEYEGGDIRLNSPIPTVFILTDFLIIFVEMTNFRQFMLLI